MAVFESFKHKIINQAAQLQFIIIFAAKKDRNLTKSL